MVPSLQELRRFLEERGEDPAKFTEKGELIAKVVELAMMTQLRRE